MTERAECHLPSSDSVSQTLGIEFTWLKNNNDPKMEPCGAPDLEELSYSIHYQPHLAPKAAVAEYDGQLCQMYLKDKKSQQL